MQAAPANYPARIFARRLRVCWIVTRRRPVELLNAGAVPSSSGGALQRGEALAISAPDSTGSETACLTVSPVRHGLASEATLHWVLAALTFGSLRLCARFSVRLSGASLVNYDFF